ncbi:MAG: ABC transporter permease [Candidatus Nanopelagicales bacterium]
MDSGPLGTTVVEPDAGAAAEVVAKERRRARLAGLSYLGKRLITYLIVAFLSLILNFVLPRMMPGDPAKQLIASIVAKTGNLPSPYAMEQIYARFGDPDENVFVAFAKYVRQTLSGDLGVSIQYYPLPVESLISRALPWTLYLALTSTILGWIIGTVVGARLGWRPGGRLDSIVTPIAMFFSSVPAFWLALLMVWYFSYEKGWFPPQGAYNSDLTPSLLNPTFLLSVLIYSLLPLATLVIVGFANWMFSMRNMMITTVNEDYVQLARAKGLPQKTVRSRYAARNALLPNFTGLAQSIGGSLTAVILAESVFIYPGVGSLLSAAQGSRDYPVIQGVMLMVILASLIFNFVADSLYVLLDPRTKES